MQDAWTRSGGGGLELFGSKNKEQIREDSINIDFAKIMFGKVRSAPGQAGSS